MQFEPVSPWPVLLSPRGSRAGLDEVLTVAIDIERPACVTVAMAKREMALMWLQEQRPAGLWAAVKWLVQTVRSLLRRA